MENEIALLVGVGFSKALQSDLTTYFKTKRNPIIIAKY